MHTLTTAVQAAAGAFQQISESASGERGRRASTGALVLRVVDRALLGESWSEFLAARATAEVEKLARGVERSVLRRLLQLAEKEATGSWAAPLAAMLVEYAGELESSQRLPEADAAISLALSTTPDCAEVALHAGRVARKLRDHDRALELYVRARELDSSGGTIARLASIGEAVVSPAAERALGRIIRRSVIAGDAEAAAVGHEERARVRRAAGDRRGAVRDLCVAAMRYTDPVDRARVAHELTDVSLVMGDMGTAREALLLAVAWGDGPQSDHARSRLHALCRSLGDEVGMRRWRTFKRPMLVSLLPPGSTRVRSAAINVLARWRTLRETPSLSPA